MKPDVEHREEERRFVAVVDGRESYLTYAPLGDDTLDYRHTWVEPALRGQGVGETLVLEALDYAREAGKRVMPSCWYVDRVVQRHPEYRDLLR